MAISTFGGAASAVSVGVIAPAGYATVAAGSTSQGYYSMPNPRPGNYAFQTSSSNTQRRLVLEVNPTGNTLGVDFICVAGNPTGSITNSGNASAITSVKFYNELWNFASSNLSSNITAVGFFNNIWFAGNNVGQIFTSTDGVNWTLRAQPVANATVRSFTWNQSTGSPLYSVVGYTGTTYLWATSTDGSTWTNRSAAENLTDIVFGNGVWVGNYVNSYVKQSTNGTSWNVTPGPIGSQTLNSTAHNGVTGAGSVFVTVGNAGSVASSNADGTTWTTRSSGVSAALNAVAFGNGLFVAVGNTGVITTSPDGVTWTVRATANQLTTYNFSSVVYGAGRWIAVTNSGSIGNSGSTYGGAFVSTDGITWRPVGGSGWGQNIARQLAASPTRILAASGGTGIYWSPDAITGAPCQFSLFCDNVATIN